MTAGDIMDSAAALLNDTQKQTYTYAAQLPYLKIALKDLRKKMELSNMPVTNEVSSVITLLAGVSTVSAITNPALPTGLVEIQQLWERPAGVDPYIPMERKDFLPHYLEGVDTSRFMIWAWINNSIRLLPANQSNDLKIDYIQELFNSVVDQNSSIDVINGDSYLFNRTAALCARFIGENKTRADELDAFAIGSFNDMEGIENKARQAISTRRRPFRSSYKNRTIL
jgi:hypothetical protein